MAKRYLFSSDAGVTKSQFIQEVITMICESLESTAEEDLFLSKKKGSEWVADLLHHTTSMGWSLEGEIYTIKESRLDLAAELCSEEWMPRLRNAVKAVEDVAKEQEAKNERWARNQDIEKYRRLYEKFNGKPPGEVK